MRELLQSAEQLTNAVADGDARALTAVRELMTVEQRHTRTVTMQALALAPRELFFRWIRALAEDSESADTLTHNPVAPEWLWIAVSERSLRASNTALASAHRERVLLAEVAAWLAARSDTPRDQGAALDAYSAWPTLMPEPSRTLSGSEALGRADTIARWIHSDRDEVSAHAADWVWTSWRALDAAELARLDTVSASGATIVARLVRIESGVARGDEFEALALALGQAGPLTSRALRALELAASGQARLRSKVAAALRAAYLSRLTTDDWARARIAESALLFELSEQSETADRTIDSRDPTSPERVLSKLARSGRADVSGAALSGLLRGAFLDNLRGADSAGVREAARALLTTENAERMDTAYLFSRALPEEGAASGLIDAWWHTLDEHRRAVQRRVSEADEPASWDDAVLRGLSEQREVDAFRAMVEGYARTLPKAALRPFFARARRYAPSTPAAGPPSEYADAE